MGRREVLQKKLAQRARREKSIVIVFPEWACPSGERIVTWMGRRPTDTEIREAIAAQDAEDAQRAGVKDIEPLDRADERRRTLEAQAMIASNREHEKKTPTVWRRCEKCHAYISVPVESTPTLCANCRPGPPQPTVA